ALDLTPTDLSFPGSVRQRGFKTTHIRLMNRILAVLIIVLLTLLPVWASAAENPFRALFNGKSLQGWTGNGAHWRVENGAITGEIRAGKTLDNNEFLFWDGALADFDLSLEFRISGGPDANSGIQFRSQRMENGGATGYQADLDQGQTWLGRI